MHNRIIIPVLLFIFLSSGLSGQRKKISIPAYVPVDTSLFKGLSWRNIGPFRGGRSAAVTGVKGKQNLYYFGATGGGVWRTKDGGLTWENISDGFFGGSIGAIEVAPSDQNVIYVGGGEETVRGNVSPGTGMWKSTDAGKTWIQIGLQLSRHIPRIRVDPKNPDIVYVAVLGDLYKDTKERGIYKSADGGKSWRQILFVNEGAGAVDLIMDPNNSRILFASTWKVRRTPYDLSSGGEGSAMWKSTDSGETWKNIAASPGLPKGIWGISGIAISPVNSDRIWAIIENADGGVFRSDDGGINWERTNADRNLRQRAWYYSRIYADPSSDNVVYVVNVSYHKSLDGGKTFSPNNATHGDHHDLWIDPDNPKRMIIGDDGGAQISYDGGENWSTYHNQPTAQFYRITTDNHFPYRIYGAQQDNSTVRIASRTGGGTIGEDDWESTAGCESGYLAVDPLNDDIVYGGCYDGVIERLDHKTGFSRHVDAWPDLPMGHGAEGSKYRFQWNFPIYFSPHDPKKLYTASNVVHESTNEGQSWKIISPDLTRNDSSKLKASGGPITKDNTSVEYYCTIFTIAESHRVKDLLWVGSDDGLIHISKSGGTSWTDVTPLFLPKWIQINSIEPDPHLDGGCYVAATMYKSGDYKPYLLRTKNYGNTWELITNGIPPEHFTRVIRSDPDHKGILYAGTEYGMYVSFDDGDHWQPLQLNLPIVPITDLTVKDHNLIAATEGRSFWILDDLHQLHQLKNDSMQAFHVFEPDNLYRLTGYGGTSKVEGTNYQGGLNVYYFMPDTLAKSDTLLISIFNTSGDTIISYSSAKEGNLKLAPEKGMNIFKWDLLYEPAKGFDGMILWGGGLGGPMAIPGMYSIEFNFQQKHYRKIFEIKKDPRSQSTGEDYQHAYEFVKSIRDKMTEANKAIISIRDIRKQILEYKDRIIQQDSVKKEISAIDSVMTDIEQKLYQTKNKSGQDPLNYPIRLTDKLSYVKSIMGNGDFPPTDQAYEVKNLLVNAIDIQLTRFEKVRLEMIPLLNDLIRSQKIDPIILKTD